jgi:hypothetical protein
MQNSTQLYILKGRRLKLSQVKKQICPGLSTLSKVGGYFEKVGGERRAK